MESNIIKQIITKIEDSTQLKFLELIDWLLSHKSVVKVVLKDWIIFETIYELVHNTKPNNPNYTEVLSLETSGKEDTSDKGLYLRICMKCPQHKNKNEKVTILHDITNYVFDTYLTKFKVCEKILTYDNTQKIYYVSHNSGNGPYNIIFDFVFEDTHSSAIVTTEMLAIYYTKTKPPFLHGICSHVFASKLCINNSEDLINLYIDLIKNKLCFYVSYVNNYDITKKCDFYSKLGFTLISHDKLT